MRIILATIGIVILAYLIGGCLYLATNGRLFKRFFHDVMRYHLPEDKETFNGCSFCSKCKYCGKEILQDWQGNWF